MNNYDKILRLLKEKLNTEESNYLDEYHLKEIESNLFFKPYDGIDQRSNSIRSSAAMIYNTIGPDSIIFDGKKYPYIVYEQEFPALNDNDKSDHDHSAHLDVSLSSEDKTELVLVEAKCLEWMHNPKTLSIAYLSEFCYRKETNRNIPHFIDSFKNLRLYPESRAPEDNSRILPYYKRYDAIQMNIHILGIYNYCAREKKNVQQKIRLLNVVWDYDKAEEYKKEEAEGKEYVAYANVAFRNVFKQVGVDFSVEYVRYSDLLKRIDWTNDMNHRKYLERYEIK